MVVVVGDAVEIILKQTIIHCKHRQNSKVSLSGLFVFDKLHTQAKKVYTKTPTTVELLTHLHPKPETHENTTPSASASRATYCYYCNITRVALGNFQWLTDNAGQSFFVPLCFLLILCSDGISVFHSTHINTHRLSYVCFCSICIYILLGKRNLDRFVFASEMEAIVS